VPRSDPAELASTLDERLRWLPSGRAGLVLPGFLRRWLDADRYSS
jgi:hypothetical protein